MKKIGTAPMILTHPGKGCNRQESMLFAVNSGWRVLMNVQKIFDILQEDQDNMALGLICGELEEQAYKVQIDGRKVTSAEIFDGDHKDLEDQLGPLEVSLYRDGSLEQEFSLEFIDDHEVVIERKIE